MDLFAVRTRVASTHTRIYIYTHARDEMHSVHVDKLAADILQILLRRGEFAQLNRLLLLLPRERKRSATRKCNTHINTHTHTNTHMRHTYYSQDFLTTYIRYVTFLYTVYVFVLLLRSH